MAQKCHMKLCQSSLREPNENWQCILRSDEPRINESGSNEVQNVWHRWAWDHHCAKTWESECWYECKKTTTHSRGTWTVFCYSKQDNWVCSFQVTRMQTVFMHVYLCAWELVLINYSGSSWWSFRLILWLFDAWQLQHLNLIRRFVWVSLWTAAQLELHQSSEQSLVQPLRPPLYQI